MKRFLVPIAILVLILAMAASSTAQTVTYDQHMSRGMSSLEKGDYSAAEEAFRSALKESPDDYKATLYLGIALNKKGEKEAQSYLKRALVMNPQEPKVNLQLGIYYYDRSVYPEAKDYFENTVGIAPNTEYSAEARAYLEKINKTPVEKPKPWRVDAAAGMQYDSNVILGPDNQPTPEGISGKSDWRGVLFLKGQYDLLTSDRFRGTVSYSVYQSLHTRLSDFNITQQVGGVDAIYRLSGVVALKGAYSFEYVLVGGDEYDYAHTFTPAVVFNYGKGFSTTFHYAYSNTHFSNGHFFEDNSDRTGFNHSGGITQFMPLTDFLDVKVGYVFDKDNTRKDFWDYTGNKVFANLTFWLPQGFSADLYGEYYHKSYFEGVFPGTQVLREDDVNTYSVTLTKKLNETFSVVLGEYYVRNNSNLVDIFDYDRSITSVFIMARF